MSRARGWLARLSNMFQRERGEREVDDELQAHLELAVEDNLRRGMTPTEARRTALARLGGMESVREQCRDVRRFGTFEDLGKDLRYGVRGLVKSRGFTAVAVLSLGLGIGVNTAVFSAVDAMLFRQFPYDDPNRLVMIRRVDLQRPDCCWGPGMPPPQIAEYLSWRQHADVFEAMASYQFASDVDVASEGHPTEQLSGVSVSPNLFAMLGVAPVLGRGFRPEDGQLDSEDVVILSHRLWQRRFGSDATVIGETLWLDRTAATVVGVMPSGFQLENSETHVWLPTRVTMADEQSRVNVIARLAPGVAIEQAQTAMDTLAVQRAEAFPETSGGWGVRLIPLHDYLTRNLRRTMFVLWGAVGFVLLIACANVAGVLLARASARTKEVATRLALGASRWRVARLFFAEGILLGLAGGALGSVLAYAGVQLIRVFNPDSNPLTFAVFPRLDAASVDGRVLGYTLLISLLTALLFSVAPALSGSRLDLTASLKDTGRGATAGAGRLRLRAALVVAQVALALVLLTGAGLMISTMRNLAAVDLGFDTEQLLTFRLSLDRERYLQDALAGEPQNVLSPRADAFHAQVLRRLQTLPGVESAAGIHVLPLSHYETMRILAIDGHHAPSANEEIDVFDLDQGWVRLAYRAVLGDYFDVMGIPLLQGRAFTARDVAEAPWVVVINRAMAEQYWPNADPIGQPLTVVCGVFGRPTPGERPRTVVGVVEDAQSWSVQELDPRATMYVPAAQRTLLPVRDSRTQMSYVVRTSANPMSLAPVVQRVVAEIDPDEPIFYMYPMAQVVAIWTDSPRFYTLLLVVFAAVALGLSLIGIYGVMAYTVTQRTHEIGIRMALGAARRHVVRLVAGRGLALGLGGVALGLVGAFWLTDLMRAFSVDFEGVSVLYGVSARDPATLVAASLLLLSAVVLACYRPTHVATKVDPMTALRHE